MGRSLAILICNTRYHELSALDCCANDVAQMRGLLSATLKFSQIVEFVDQSVSKVKDELRRLTELEEGFDDGQTKLRHHGAK